MTEKVDIYKVDDPSTIRPLGKLDRDSWEVLSNLTITRQTRNAFTQYQDYSNPVTTIKLGPPLKEYRDLFEEMYLYEARLHRRPDGEPVDKGVFERRSSIYNSFAREARRKKNYSVVFEMMDKVGKLKDQPEVVLHTLVNSVANLYLLMCESDRFIVGARDGIYWRDIEIPVAGDKNIDAPVDYIANYYLYYIKLIGREELPLVSTRLVHPGVVPFVHFPSGLRKLEDSLEDAFYDKEYDVDKEGARIAFKNGGDLRSMLLMEKDRRVWAKIITNFGEGLVVVDNEDGGWLDPSDMALIEDQGGGEGDWVKLTGEVYADLLTRKEIPVLDDGEEFPIKVVTSDPNKPQRPYLIYIPRKHYHGTKKFPRYKYEGPRRPPRLHNVKHHLRERPMTEAHRQELKRWEEETGFKVPKDIPPTKTFVRPHISPTEANERIHELPIFVKNKFQKEMDEQIKELLQQS